MKRKDIWANVDQKKLLELPVSIKSWVILREYINSHADLPVFQKLIDEYCCEIPAFETAQILEHANYMFYSEEDRRSLMKLIFEKPR